MIYSKSGVQGTRKAVVFFSNGMGALILKTGNICQVSELIGNEDECEILENTAKQVSENELDKLIITIKEMKPD